MFCCICASAVDDVGLKRQRRFLNGSYVPRMRSVCGIAVAMQEQEAVRPLGIYRVSQEEMSIFWEVIVSVILSKRVYMYMCSSPNGFWDRAISRNSCKIVDKEILRVVSNIGIYCSSDRVGTAYLVQYIFGNSTININALCI